MCVIYSVRLSSRLVSASHSGSNPARSRNVFVRLATSIEAFLWTDPSFREPNHILKNIHFLRMNSESKNSKIGSSVLTEARTRQADEPTKLSYTTLHLKTVENKTVHAQDKPGFA
jgi:hypothetical protein